MIPSIFQRACVRYRVEVLDASGRVLRRERRRRNLILDQGLDGIAVRSWAASFTYAVVGTGATPTKRDSGAVTVSRAGDVLTASAGFFEAADVGRLFKFDTGEEVRIAGYTSATEVTTATSGDIAAAEGTVWYVNQTALSAELMRTATYSSDSGANGSTYAAGVLTHKRTFVFPAVGGPVTVREIAWSHTSSPGANLFGRDLLAGAGVTLLSGQQLRVTVELSVLYSPVSATAAASVGAGGFDSAGSFSLQGLAVEYVSAGGGTTAGSVFAGYGADPHAQKAIVLATDGGALAAANFGAGPSVSGELASVNVSGSAYAAGSFARTFGHTFSVGQGNSSSIRSLALCYLDSVGSRRSCLRHLLGAPQTKTSVQTLRVAFTMTWGRTLVN